MRGWWRTNGNVEGLRIRVIAVVAGHALGRERQAGGRQLKIAGRHAARDHFVPDLDAHRAARGDGVAPPHPHRLAGIVGRQHKGEGLGVDPRRQRHLLDLACGGRART